MSNSMISVRIPLPLVDELKEVSKKDHFLDLSETVRSVIRNNWFKHKEPQAYELKLLRKEISENVGKKNQDEFIEELRKIKEEIIRKKDE